MHRVHVLIHFGPRTWLPACASVSHEEQRALGSPPISAMVPIPMGTNMTITESYTADPLIIAGELYSSPLPARIHSDAA